MKRRSAWGPVGLVVLALLLAGSSGARAQTEAPSGTSPVTTRASEHAPMDDYENPRLMGLGLGARASVAGTAAAAANAANLPLLRLYHVETGVRYMPGQNAWSLGGAFADSVTSKLAAGFVSRGVWGNGDRDYSGYDFKLAFGLAASPRLGIGFATRYVKLGSDRHTTDGQALADTAKGFTVDLSLRASLFEGFHIAALAYNLVDLHSTLTPRMFGGGVAYSYEGKLDVGVDVLADFTSADKAKILLGVGVGYFAGGAVPLRLGYVFDQLRENHTLTTSVGYVSRQYAIEMAFRKSISTPDTTLLLTFRYHQQ